MDKEGSEVVSPVFVFVFVCVFVIVSGMMTKMLGAGGGWAVVGSGDKQGYKVVSPAATSGHL